MNTLCLASNERKSNIVWPITALTGWKNGKGSYSFNHVFFEGNLEAEKNKQAMKLNLSPGHKTCFDLIIACWQFSVCWKKKKEGKSWKITILIVLLCQNDRFIAEQICFDGFSKVIITKYHYSPGNRLFMELSAFTLCSYYVVRMSG